MSCLTSRLPRILLIALTLCGAGRAPAAEEAGTAVAEAPIHADEGRPHIEWRDARQVIGQVAFVYGKVITAPQVGRINFINFDSNRPAQFAGVIFNDHRGKFPESLKDAYVGKNVRMRGMVSTFQGNPQIVLSDPAQIDVIDVLPDLKPLTDRPQGPKEGELVIGAYNVLNLFDNIDDPYRDDEGTPAKPRSELTALAKSIKALNADVLALEEVENRFYLERFVEVFLPDMGYDHVVHFEGNDNRGIDVCLLSRVPVGVVKSHRHLVFPGASGEPRRFSRDVLVVTLLPEGANPIEAWVVHLKSNAGGREFAEPTRVAEAKALRGLIDAELEARPDSEFIVMGDFNDTPESATLKTIVGEGENALWSAATELMDEKPITYNTGEYKSMIDFLLCSPALAKRHISGSTRIIPGSPQETGSDHNPIAAAFRLK
ncbi:MAG: endonuclease/exonuclease/phosphatase family protein [Pirellulales bacterium]|nr:endonuclease/exonuclease/phosphatase family protein [Pirellulales bacterium]